MKPPVPRNRAKPRSTQPKNLPNSATAPSRQERYHLQPPAPTPKAQDLKAAVPPQISIILPCRNEAAALQALLPLIRQALPEAEVLVVDDASTDGSAQIAAAQGARCIRHPYQQGNGAAIKTGARAASGQTLIFMDADVQHNPADLPRLLERYRSGFDMVVGARRTGSQATRARGLANGLYNRLASYMTGQPVEDLTCGFRIVRADLFREFLYLLPNGFSYPTTITMAFFRAGYHVSYVPITAARRIGRSHVHPFQDGLRFLLIIFKIGSLYSPLKIFVPVSFIFFLLGGGYWFYTYSTLQRLSIMTVFMLTTAVLVFLIGLVSEQITQLIYRPANLPAPGPSGAMTDHPSTPARNRGSNDILNVLGKMPPLEEPRACNELVAVGEAIGRQAGRQEARKREVRLVLRLLQRRVGPLAETQKACVAALADEPLDDLGEALFDFADVADLNAWLAGH